MAVPANGWPPSIVIKWDHIKTVCSISGIGVGFPTHQWREDGFSYINLDLAFLNDSTEPPIHPLQLGFLRDKMCAAAPGKRQQCIPFFIISSKKGSKDSREKAGMN